MEGVIEPKKEVKDGQEDRGAGLAQMGGWVEVVTSLGRPAVKGWRSLPGHAHQGEPPAPPCTQGQAMRS